MSMVIWKRTIGINDQYQVIDGVPEDAEILTVQVQQGTPKIWFLCDPKKELKNRIISVVGTGESMLVPESFGRTGEYIGTFQTDNGYFVWHVFDVGEQ